MNKKRIISTIIVAVAIIFIGLVAYFIFVGDREDMQVIQAPPTLPELSEETALFVLTQETEHYRPFILLETGCIAEGIQGYYASCDLDIIQESDRAWIVRIIYDGLYDDSVKAKQIRTVMMYENGQWTKGEVSQTQQCQPGRGHQDFSSELCI